MALLDKFKGKIGGGIRPNQFMVEVYKPNGLAGAGLFADSKYLGNATTLPGSMVGQAPTFHRGRMIPLSGERNFNPWAVTFYADQDMAMRTAFEYWSNLMNKYADNTGETDPTQYKGRAEVFLLDRNHDGIVLKNDNIVSYEILGIFPIDISEMQVAWEMNDQVSTFSVTFAVEDVRPVSLAGQMGEENNPNVYGSSL